MVPSDVGGTRAVASLAFRAEDGDDTEVVPPVGGVVLTPTSSAFKHLRASPSLSLARCRRASASILTLYLPRPRSESASARSIKISSCSTVSGSSRKTSDRETRALLTEKDGW